MSVLDKDITTVADLKAEIMTLKGVISVRDQEIKSLKKQLEQERIISHNANFESTIIQECRDRILMDELEAWRSFGARMMKCVEHDPVWEKLKDTVYIKDEDRDEYSYEMSQHIVRAYEDPDYIRLKCGIKATISHAFEKARDAVNKAVAEMREHVEKERARSIAQLDRNKI